MKNVLLFAIGIAFLLPVGAQAQEYYECVVTSDSSRGGVCENFGGYSHMCQLYGGYSGVGIPEHCSSFCVDRSDIPEGCVVVSVRASSNPEAHKARAGILDGAAIESEALQDIAGELQEKLQGIEGEINTEDGISDSEISYIISRVVDAIRSILGERLTGFLPNSDEAEVTPEDDEYDELTEEDFFDTGLESTGFNEYRTEKWPDEDGVTIAKVVDPYGVERYTSDGKHFYDSPYDAAHSGEGFSALTNSIGDAWEGFTGAFSFQAKLPDADLELQRTIAREVLSDAKSQRDKDVEEAYEKLSKKISVPTGGGVPAKVIVTVAKEANETDFAQGVMRYIKEREAGLSQSTIRENFSEELYEGYGSFGAGISQGTAAKQATAVLEARYEEAYIRYKLAKEFGRTK